jgi:SAM-dependent methyltransferase
MDKNFRNLVEDVEAYYSNKIIKHGLTPNGVDWKDEASQLLRFEQLFKLFPVDTKGTFSVVDFGCGYGAFYPIIRQAYPNVKYFGLDVSPKMIDEAINLHKNTTASFVTKLTDEFCCDYLVASGILNVRLNASPEEWEEYVMNLLEQWNLLSRKGFAFNALTSYSDPPFMRQDLHYADPTILFDYCKRKFSRFVTLIHDYPLYEFTIIVRKDIDD